MTDSLPTPTTLSKFKRLRKSTSVWFDILLAVILLAAVSFRMVGLYWGEYTYLHPDERFLIWVGTDITPMQCEDPNIDPNACPEEKLRWMNVGEYFDTVQSTLNPQNRNHEFYVYGTFPMFLTRYVVQWVYGHSGFQEMTDAGRLLSAIADIFTVLVTYFIGKRLYNRTVGLLGAAFLATSVLHIQQSHFFTMDTFITLFTLLAFYFAVSVSMDRQEWPALKRFFRHPLFLPSLLFGITLGLAMASKLNAYLMAAMLPAAMLIRLVRFPAEVRVRRGLEAFIFLSMAGIVSLVVFRLFQPYAFLGPGILGLQLSPEWLSSIKSMLAQRSLDVDFPPALQWARRSFFFSGQNLVVWGLGLPLGILAFSGFFWMAWRILTSLGRDEEWQQHALIWLWTAIYFGYQSMGINPTMRYQMPVYPTLVIIAAWAVWQIWELARQAKGQSTNFFQRNGKLLAWGLGAGVLLATVLWAFAFTRIYVRPITRVEASRWILNNIPGAVNLRLQTTDGLYNQPVPFPNQFAIQGGIPYNINFKPKKSGTLSEIYLPHIKDSEGVSQVRDLEARIYEGSDRSNPIAQGSISADFTQGIDPRGSEHTIPLDSPVFLDENRTYTLDLQIPFKETFSSFQGTLELGITEKDGTLYHQVLDDRAVFEPTYPFTTYFAPDVSGALTELQVKDIDGASPDQNPGFSLSLLELGTDQSLVERVMIPLETSEPGTLQYELSEPITLTQDIEYQLRINPPSQGGRLALSPDVVLNEGDWDDGLPLRMDGYDPFGGIYPPDVNLNIVYEDTPDKLERVVNLLNTSDYIVISSNRQYGTMTRMPERFPMTTQYYRRLIGCPEDKEILWCYQVAEPGSFAGEMGFELVKTFQSDPSLGPLRFNSQFAEEAFTVYDHPKVLIFKKTDAYNPEQTRELLSSVDFNSIIRKPPLRYSSYPADLLLPDERLSAQQEGGTWSEIFGSWINRSQILTVIVWYLALFGIGWIVYPILRLALPGLRDKGYPLSKITGLLLLSYFVWLAGSYEIPFSQTTISIVILIIALVGGILAFTQRKDLGKELKNNWRYFLSVEGIFLAFFLLDLVIRLGNPDLWHPYKGGEKPMDFAYFNAVLKSTTFPPYDPWYAGGYLNYYYYGFVLIGVLVKWLGIAPAVAYNLALPTIFGLIAIGAFSITWNLFGVTKTSNPETPTHKRTLQYLVGIAGAVGMALLGNLGTVRMFWHGYQRLGSPSGSLEGASVLNQVTWGLSGFVQAITGQSLPYSLGDWYWIPSRVIPPQGDVEPITEFPFFTVLFADLHAHLFALPLTLLALAFAISVVLSKSRWQSILAGVLGFFIGALAIGSLRPTNTWDFPTYLALSLVAFGYSIGANYQPSERLMERIPALGLFKLPYQRALVALGAMVLLAGLSLILFLPFSQWYALGYTQVKLWWGPRTPVTSYLIHWGLFLFIIISWMIWAARDWLENTPVSALRKIQPLAGIIAALAAIFLILITFLSVKLPGLENLPFGKGIQIAWLALPLAVFAAILLLRPNQPDSQRIILFLVGTGLFLTLVVEIVVLAGDIGRMNTVFKFYLQVWTLFSISAAVAFGWLLEVLPAWVPQWRRAWQVVAFFLLIGAALYPLTSTVAKVKDRMAEDAPYTLDGMKYMETAFYDWKGPMDLSEDYRAIRWMQENIQGSPVIVEANLRDLYRWGSRFSINTGLPSVVGWEWHQQQQRVINPSLWVSNRIGEVDDFYNTINLDRAKEFLEKYDVQYFVVGPLERNLFPQLSLEKFANANGILWEEVYRDGETVIYRVIRVES